MSSAIATIDILGSSDTPLVTSSSTGATTKELTARMGHASVRAALIYQHASRSRDKEIADAISLNVQEARRIGHGRGTPEDMTG